MQAVKQHASAVQTEVTLPLKKIFENMKPI